MSSNPPASLAPHRPHARCFHEYSPERRCFELRSIGPPPAGQEALITYGNKSNRRLFEQYGFSVPGNPFDRIDLSEVRDPTGGSSALCV